MEQEYVDYLKQQNKSIGTIEIYLRNLECYKNGYLTQLDLNLKNYIVKIYKTISPTLEVLKKLKKDYH